MMVLTKRVLQGVTVAATCLSLLTLGCARDPMQDPKPPDIKPLLQGQTLNLDPDNEIMIDLSDLSAFEVVETVIGPEGKSATAVVRFKYRTESITYEVEGVVSYDRTESGKALNPVFETNSADLSG